MLIFKGKTKCWSKNICCTQNTITTFTFITCATMRIETDRTIKYISAHNTKQESGTFFFLKEITNTTTYNRKEKKWKKLISFIMFYIFLYLYKVDIKLLTIYTLNILFFRDDIVQMFNKTMFLVFICFCYCSNLTCNLIYVSWRLIYESSCLYSFLQTLNYIKYVRRSQQNWANFIDFFPFI